MDLVKQLSFWIKIRLQLLVLPFVTVIVLLVKADNFGFLATNCIVLELSRITFSIVDYATERFSLLLFFFSDKRRPATTHAHYQ